jgi:predicted amidohydrolase
MLKFTLAQINPTIGDIEGNIALMRDAAAYRSQMRQLERFE